MDSETVLKTEWIGSIQGSGITHSPVLNTVIAVPSEFGGTGMGSGPMDFLVASAATCYLMTVVGMLEAKKIKIIDLILHTETASKTKVLVINHFLELKISSNLTEEQSKIAENIIVKADRACHVGNMLRKADVQINIQSKLIQI